MLLFVLATLTPLPLFALGLSIGGGWALAGFVYMALLSALLDQIGAFYLGSAPEGAEFPAAVGLLVTVGIGALLLLPAMIWAISANSGLGIAARIALFTGAGLWFGQVANPAAHELIHRGDRHLYLLGVAIYTALLFGHHASAHRLVHHRYAASAQDPNSARAGESFYHFAPRAWIGSFRQGWQAENELRTRASSRRRIHPYAIYIGGAGLTLALGAAIAGFPGMFVVLGLGLHATMQLLLSDYVQHYGLQREVLANGRLTPVSARHSWNAAQWFSAGMMLNAPRHSDHHAHPGRPYPALRLPAADEAPRLPWSLPVACTIALFPRLWRRMMAPRLARWSAHPQS
jgi:alkane 1-monooxygenase